MIAELAREVTRSFSLVLYLVYTRTQLTLYPEPNPVALRIRAFHLATLVRDMVVSCCVTNYDTNCMMQTI